MSEPSFAQLFRRSRYSRLDLGQQDLPGSARLEVFAVAAVGFALKHDLEFKKKFLEKFAGVTGDIGDFRPFIQAANCTDLKLEHLKMGILVVVEFKIRADLEAHQDPWSKSEKGAFWSEELQGYGWQYGNNTSLNGFSTVHYTVVEQDGKGGSPREESCVKFGKTYQLRKRNWGCLLPPESGLEEDLISSLGELGVNELKEYLMKDVKIKSEDLENFYKGRSVSEILLQVANKVGIRQDVARRNLMEYFMEWYDEDECHLGVDVKDLWGQQVKFAEPGRPADPAAPDFQTRPRSVGVRASINIVLLCPTENREEPTVAD